MKNYLKALLISTSLAAMAGLAHADTAYDTTSPIKVAMVPKLIGLSVFKANEQGAEEASKSLNIDFLYTGPVTASAQGQVDIINSLTARKFGAITVTSNNPTELAPSLKRAMHHGIAVVSYDSDVSPDARDFFIQDTAYPAMGKALVDSVEGFTGPNAQIAILSSTPDATIQNAWLDAVKTYIAATYPNMKIVTTQYGQSSPSESLSAGLNILHAYPQVTAIIAPDGAAEVGAAAAIEKLGLQGKVVTTGTSDPNSIRQYVKDGVIKASPLWDEVGEGQLVMYVARLAANHALKPDDTFTVPGLGTYTVNNKVIIFSEPLVFTADNIDKYQF
jgi:ABC-type sugar transport system substrate-binding protein